MTKIAKSYTFNGDLTSAIGILATKLGQSKSQLVENTLRKDPEIELVLKQIHSMDSMPDYVLKSSKEVVIGTISDNTAVMPKGVFIGTMPNHTSGMKKVTA